jgi:TPR repeat protein
MIVESQRAFANEPLPLGIWLNDAAGSETLTMVGLTAGTKLSAGTPLGLTGWQVTARDLNKAYAFAPKDFVGVMDAAIDLRSRDRLVDSQFVRLEWVAKKEPPPTSRVEAPKPGIAIQILEPQEIANLLKRGEAFVKSGDIPSARIALRRAANADSAQAMLALGRTFDPDFLSEQGVLGFAADTEQARAWYEKAIRLGSPEASRRLARLANVQ